MEWPPAAEDPVCDVDAPVRCPDVIQFQFHSSRPDKKRRPRRQREKWREGEKKIFNLPSFFLSSFFLPPPTSPVTSIAPYREERNRSIYSIDRYTQTNKSKLFAAGSTLFSFRRRRCRRRRCYSVLKRTFPLQCADGLCDRKGGDIIQWSLSFFLLFYSSPFSYSLLFRFRYDSASDGLSIDSRSNRTCLLFNFLQHPFDIS